MTDRDEPDLTAPRRALVLIDVQNEYARLPLRIRYPRLRDCLEQIEHGSIYAGPDLAAWLHEQGVNTVTLVGFMVNNCVLASAAWGETIGLATEVLSDAVGAINLRNCAGKADARTVHTTLMALLHSNWAAVATADDWCRALARREPLPRSNLVVSAMAPF